MVHTICRCCGAATANDTLVPGATISDSGDIFGALWLSLLTAV